MRTQTSKRFLSLVLVLCMLVSMLVLPASAATTGDTQSSSVTSVLLNNTFQDGTIFYNGGKTVNNSDSFMTLATSGSNKYLQMGSDSGSVDTYIEYNVGGYTSTSGSIVLQFDVMVNSTTDLGNLINVFNASSEGSATVTQVLLAINKGNNAVISPLGTKGYTTSGSCGSTTTTDTYALTNGAWKTVAFEFTYTSVDSITVTSYWGDQGATSLTKMNSTTLSGTDARPQGIRLRCSDNGTYNLDNILFYTATGTSAGSSVNLTVSSSDMGLMYNTYAESDADISDFEGAYYFKVNALSALTADDAKVTLTEAPFKYNGGYYIPVSALVAVTGATPASTYNETINGITAVNIEYMDELYGWYASYNSTGLIAVAAGENILDGCPNAALMLIMKKFLFDNITYNTASGDYENAGAFDVSDMLSLDHPYLYADQEKFDELAAVWAAGQAGESGVDATLYSYINSRVTTAKNLYKTYAQVDAEGNYSAMNTTVGLVRGHQDHIGEIPYQTTGATGGYDVGGRQGDSANNNERILSLAYAYQITKDVNYAKLAYQYATYMGQWEHWGPGHFLNVADASSPYAVAYDWLYDAWVSLGLDVSAIETIIFTHSILPAYYTLHDDGNAWYNPKLNNSGWGFYTHTNNWNAVCSAGVSISAMALIGVTTASAGTMIDTTIDGTYNPTVAYNGSNILTTSAGKNTATPSIDTSWTYQDFCEYNIGECLYYLPLNGLTQYVPDGSYIESNGYWSYGTNNLYELTAALVTATGNDYGILDAWGMDRTAYFALNTMSSDGQSWNYHDSDTVGPQDTLWFQFVGSEQGIDDVNLAAIRHYLLAEGLGTPSIYDSLFYVPADDGMIDEALASLELSYYMEGIDGFVVRDSWERGGSYAAFMGQSNNITHGQIDSGSFVYYNNGTMWFGDLGTENYNAYGFWETGTRYRYYKMGAEGNNTLILTSKQDTLQYGQNLNGYGKMITAESNEYGAWSVINNTSVYAGLASEAYRGLLMTNDRKTIVLQDQVTFTEAQSAAWIAHTQQKVILSVDGTVAYMFDGETAIKVTLIDNAGTGAKFQIMDASDYLLDCTLGPNYSVENGGVAQDSIDGWQKLVIEFTDVTTINVAVVMEEVPMGSTVADNFNVGYTWVDMMNWVAAAGDNNEGPGDVEENEAVATITVVTPENVVPEVDPDTPIIDLFSANLSPASVVAAAEEGEATTEVFTAYTFEELAGYINSASSSATITVDLFASNTTIINIANPCVINTNGNTLLATSSDYIADIGDGTVEYKSGSITVTYNVGGTVKTKTFRGSVVFADTTAATSSTIKEVDNGDGTFSYYTAGGKWSLTEGGSPATDYDLIVTTANKRFYSTDTKYTGLFVTVKGSTITGYTEAEDFFKSTVLNGGLDKVSVTNDFSFDATNGKVDGHTTHNLNLYLNGYTITYTTTDTSDHMFSTTANGTNNFYGPGGIVSEASQSNIGITNGTNYFYDLDIYSVRAVLDHRAGLSVFKNCNITIESGYNSAMGVLNRNNAQQENPKVVMDGCNINMPYVNASVAVFSIQSNGTIEVTGGTSISTATPNILFRITNATVGTDDTYNWANGCANAQAIIGEVYHNCASIGTYSTSATDGTTGMPSAANIFYGNTYKSATDPSSLNLVDDVVVVRCDDDNYPYVLSSEGYATVTWMNGSTPIATEYWQDGTVPSASADIKAAVSVASGKMLSFDTTRVVAGNSYTFTASVIDSFGLKVNMTLEGDFYLNFFVEKKDGMTFKLDGETVVGTVTNLNGTDYYKISKIGIAPNNAGASVKLEVTYGNATVSRSISPIAYAEKILASDAQSDAAKAMMINVVKYIEAAYVYTGSNLGATAPDYAAVRALYYEYEHLATVSAVNRAVADISSVTDAIYSAQLNLDDEFKMRFNFKSTYTGDVTFSYVASGETRTVTVSVVNGTTSAGKTYTELTRKAYDMMGAVTVTTAGGTASYGLNNYYHAVATGFNNDTYLLNALCSYCEAAKVYNDSLN